LQQNKLIETHKARVMKPPKLEISEVNEVNEVNEVSEAYPKWE
jgi:hypothetical protein